MANEDMDGAFFGGGAVDHVVSGGDIFLRADQIAQVMSQTGIKMAIAAIKANDPAGGSTAHMLLIISEKLYELRSELLKREIEASFSLED